MALIALILICAAVIVTSNRPLYDRLLRATYQMPGQMKIGAGALLGALILVTNPSIAQQGLILTVGKLNYLESVQGLEQQFSVKNDTPNVVASVMVTCGFFNNGQLIATERTLIENISGNATGVGKVFAFSDIIPDRTRCRIGPAF